MPELADVLDRIGLSEYLPTLIRNGFSTWENTLDIAEADLDHLGFKLGHRRLLQREVASYRGHPQHEGLQGESGNSA
ncbi:hypothetical protein LTS18_014316, partial [Coniosporium uncinatum]